jgi:hypothetical protein
MLVEYAFILILAIFFVFADKALWKLIATSRSSRAGWAVE